MNRLRLSLSVLLSLVLIFQLAACASGARRLASPWSAADLRLLHTAGSAATASTDILAVYARFTSQDFQVRVDLLDLSLEDAYRLDLVLYDGDHLPMGMSISPDGSTRLADLATGEPVTLRARVVRDPGLDTITISFNRFLLSDRVSFSVATFLPEELPSGSPPDPGTWDQTAQDSTPRLSITDLPPAGRAYAVLSFTDCFPAATPAQAFRRWDGAHTGPTGERHGLKHVLDSARAYGLPVALLDLKTPASLAALDFLGETDTLRQMLRDDLLILPQVAYGIPAEEPLESSRVAGQAYGLPLSPFDYGAGGGVLPQAGLQFAVLADSTHLTRSRGNLLVPRAMVSASRQATEDGPSLELRRALMDTALSADPSDLVALGGSLPHSTWGDSDMAAPTFAWLAAHPWVHVLSSRDLQDFTAVVGEVLPSALLPTDPFLPALQAAPRNAITASAWQAYFMLTAPTSDPGLQTLQSDYLRQVGILISASRWADAPYSLQECGPGSEQGLSSECILATPAWFAVIETDGARLLYLFHGEHQLVGPTAQFAIGLSDPSTWEQVTGDGADPGQVMGAFFDSTNPYEAYTAAWPDADTLLLTNQDGSRQKTFRLTQAGLEATLQGSISLRIPLVVDPQAFFAGPSSYRARLTPDSWTWGPAGGTTAMVTTDAPFSAQGFTASLPFIGLPENPDLGYPSGHYLPFPLSMVEITAQGPFWVRIGLP